MVKRRLRRTLASERGDIMTESIMGAVIVSLIVISVVAVFMVMSKASIVAAANTNREIHLRSQLTLMLPAAPALPAEERITRTATVEEDQVDGGQVPVTIWRESISELESRLYATTPRYGQEDAECTEPDRQVCLVQVLPVTHDLGGVAASTLALGTEVAAGGEITAAQIPDGVDEVRYVVAVTQNSGDSRLIFRSRSTPSAQYVVDVPAGTTGYLYGGLDVTGVTDVYAVHEGPAVFDTARSLIYEAPDAHS